MSSVSNNKYTVVLFVPDFYEYREFLEKKQHFTTFENILITRKKDLLWQMYLI